MAQLVQLQKEAGDEFKKHGANVLVVFREESEGQAGLQKVVDQTDTPFTLALDTPADVTQRYSPGNQVHDSYVIGSGGVIRAILKATRYDRAEADEFIAVLEDLE